MSDTPIFIVLDTREAVIELKGRGWLHPAKIAGRCTRTQLNKLIGNKFNGDPILGIESFAVEDQTNRGIGILTKQKHWGLSGEEKTQANQAMQKMSVEKIHQPA